MTGIDPERLGVFVGNQVNAMSDFPTQEDIDAAVQAAQLGTLETLTDFDEKVVPEEDTWGLPERN